MLSECAWYLHDYWASFIYYFTFTYVIRRIVLLWTLLDTAAMLHGQQQSEASRESYQKRWDSGRHRNVDLSPHETAEHNWARDSHLAGRAHPKGRRGSPRHSPGCLLICRCRAILEWNGAGGNGQLLRFMASGLMVIHCFKQTPTTVWRKGETWLNFSTCNDQCFRW